MKINPAIFKAYDIRGIYPQDINEENISPIIQAIYYYLLKKLKKESITLVLGHDMRISSSILFEKIKKILFSLGAKIIDVGLATTPTVYFTAHNNQSDGGIQITASHNPPQWNGIKFFFCQNRKIYKASKEMGMEEIKQLVLQKAIKLPQREGEIRKKSDAVKDEVKFAFSLIKPKYRRFKIALDPANAMGIILFDEIFKQYPADLIKLNYFLDGTFPAHEANPLKFETLSQLQKKVVETRADFGIATDGDADRVFFIDEKGNIVPSTLVSALIADQILKKNRNAGIISDVRYIYNVKKVVEKYNGKFYLSPVGHALITKKLNEENASFCGESSGHYYFSEYGGAESVARVIITIIDVLSRENKPLSTILKNYRQSYESGEINFRIPEHLTLKDVFDKIQAKFPFEKIDHLDGLTVEDGEFRLNLRGSNTEPLIRLNCESLDEKKLKQNLLMIKNFLNDIGLQPV